MSKYVSNVHAKPQKIGGSTSEIKRTMKASKIQRDVVSYTLCIIMVSMFASHALASAWDKADLTATLLFYNNCISNFPQDIVNHVIDDLDEFMERIRVTTAAWNDLEKRKGQKSKRKKQAGNNSIMMRSVVATILKCSYLEEMSCPLNTTYTHYLTLWISCSRFGSTQEESRASKRDRVYQNLSKVQVWHQSDS